MYIFNWVYLTVVFTYHLTRNKSTLNGAQWSGHKYNSAGSPQHNGGRDNNGACGCCRCLCRCCPVLLERSMRDPGRVLFTQHFVSQNSQVATRSRATGGARRVHWRSQSQAGREGAFSRAAAPRNSLSDSSAGATTLRLGASALGKPEQVGRQASLACVIRRASRFRPSREPLADCRPATAARRRRRRKRLGMESRPL